MDEELLARARRAEERLIEAEHDAEVARADFHRAVRRLHLSGASMRELAGALALSHQRVHQIVGAAGGSRRWRVRREQPSWLACSFCGRVQRETHALVSGPGVYICDKCIALAGTVMDSGRTAQTALGPLRAVSAEATDQRCSFCGKRRRLVSGMAATSRDPVGKAGTPPAVCAECLTLCREIRAEHLT